MVIEYSKPGGMSEKQWNALKLGQQIRNVACMDSLAARFFPDDLRKEVRTICDKQMHRLGYESITEHRERTREIWNTSEPEKWTNAQWAKFYKYRRLDAPAP